MQEIWCDDGSREGTFLFEQEDNKTHLKYWNIFINQNCCIAMNQGQEFAEKTIKLIYFNVAQLFLIS